MSTIETTSEDPIPSEETTTDDSIGNDTFVVTYSEELANSFTGDLIQLIIYFHILPVVTTIMFALTIHNCLKRKAEQRRLRMKTQMYDHFTQIIQNGFCKYCYPSKEFYEEGHTREKVVPGCPEIPNKNETTATGTPPNQSTDQSTSASALNIASPAPKPAPPYGTVGIPTERTPMPLSKKMMKKVRKEKKEQDEKAFKFKDRGPIVFHTQNVVAADLMIEERKEKDIKIKKVKWDEKPINSYETGLSVDQVDIPTPSTKGDTYSSIMTASIKQLKPH
ncbi:hypothetical protein GCK72_008742 [Caenorhabditis remanei]|uniref:Uncharacterized protein n=1 Tax=Caenorhabditis remanei TaxID=31234 RepID=A0A6A5H1P3_CAERE|nr:hypothetical protein GCK72_008742 [Caenorhabditis remanei]KAF1760493.1 hypothetical protein GCK72_008742 [Caenorhabditis remanei]